MINNPVVTIELDRVRELRFGHKAMKRWSAYTGKSIDQLNTGEFRPDEVETLLYFMLERDALEHGEQLKMEDMEDLLDMAPLGEIYKKLSQAVEAAFPEVEESSKNVKRAAGGTGRKS